MISERHEGTLGEEIIVEILLMDAGILAPLEGI